MGNRTLGQIIEQYEQSDRNWSTFVDHGVEAAIAAAYWAGQESMRGKIVRRIAERVDEYQLGRYHESGASGDAGGAVGWAARRAGSGRLG